MNNYYQFSLRELVCAILAFAFLLGWICSGYKYEYELESSIKDFQQIKEKGDQKISFLQNQIDNMNWSNAHSHYRSHFNAWKFKRPDGSIDLVLIKASDNENHEILIHEIDPPLDLKWARGNFHFLIKPSPTDAADGRTPSEASAHDECDECPERTEKN